MDIDIFNNNAFSLTELTAALQEVDYLPNGLGAMNIFTESSARTENVWIEKKETVLSLVPTTPRGAALPQGNQKRREGRSFKSVRIAKGDTLWASEIAGIRAFGTETELMQAQQEVLTRMVNLRNDVELTHENMRLGAVQGIVTDADGTPLYNWFDEWSITQPTEDSWAFGTLIDGALRKKCAQVIRTMARASKGAWGPNTQVIGLCGDDFYDALISNPEVRATYLNWTAAADLRQASFWTGFNFGGITWINYRGTDDNNKVAVPASKVKFFPMNAPGAFLRINTPGEFFDTINQPGQQFYALTIPDDERNAYVETEVYSYPLYVATRPAMLLRGKNV